MKKSKRFTLTICILVGIAFFCAGIFLGSYKGWKKESQALHTISADKNNVGQLLAYQGADVSNLLVVARRHLNADDASIAALQKTKDLLIYNTALEQQYEAFVLLPGQVNDIVALLKATDSFNNSQRDQAYLSTLEKDLAYLTATIKSSGYNQAAEIFNNRFSVSLSGRIARMLGINPAPVFR